MFKNMILRWKRPLLVVGAVLACAASAAAWVTALSGGDFSVPVTAFLAGSGTASAGAFTHTYAIGGSAAQMQGGGYTLTPGPLGAQVAARQTLDDAHAFPTPFIPARGHNKITFTALTAQATVRVYTLSGRLVKTLTKNDGLDFLVWSPVVNDSGEPLASGVYLFVVSHPGGIPKKGKLMIVK